MKVLNLNSSVVRSKRIIAKVFVSRLGLEVPIFTMEQPCYLGCWSQAGKDLERIAVIGKLSEI